MKLPPFFTDSSYTAPLGNEHFSLNYSSIYRLSPLDNAAESSKGWLFRVLEVRPNTFSLLTPLLPEKIKCSSKMIPKELNLLNYRISEICKCYQLDFVNFNGSVNKIGSVTELGVIIRKVIVLWNFFDDCEFAVLALVSKMTKDSTWINNDLRYWKYGDKDWTTIDIQNYEFDDVIFFGGKCYAIGIKGDLVSFDSDFNPFLHFTSDEYILDCHNNFVVYKSDLFIVSKIYNREPDEMSSEFEGRYSSCDDFSTPRYYDSEEEEKEKEKEDSPLYYSTDDYDDYSDHKPIVEDDSNDEIPLRAKLFNVQDGYGWQYTNVGRDDFFLSSDDVSVGLATKDFGDCSGNCIYMAHKYFSYCDEEIEYGDNHSVFSFYGSRTSSLILNMAPDHAKIYWPPPDWLHQ